MTSSAILSRCISIVILAKARIQVPQAMCQLLWILAFARMTATNWPASRTYTGFIQRGSAQAGVELAMTIGPVQRLVRLCAAQ
jgi:hypothetical protein